MSTRVFLLFTSFHVRTPTIRFQRSPRSPDYPLHYSFCPIWVKLKKKEFMRNYGSRAGPTWSHRGLARKWNSFCPNYAYIGGQEYVQLPETERLKRSLIRGGGTRWRLRIRFGVCGSLGGQKRSNQNGNLLLG